jgi:AcrR family transcriptional regulator
VPLDTRQRLLEAAWGCIRDDGLDGATSRSITSAANANLGAITYHFGSKEALLAEAVVAAIGRLIAPAMQALTETDLDPASRLLAVIAYLQASYRGAADDAPAYLEVLIQSRRAPLLRERLGEMLGELRAALAALMAEYKSLGLLPEWVETEPMAALLLAVAQGVVLQTVVDGAGPGAGAMASQFSELLLAARVQP